VANRPLAVLDLETDPFRYGRVPKPFLSGFYDGSTFISTWDEDRCITRTVELLASRKVPTIIYAHNGGKFDWMYFLEHLSNRSNLRIINGRIVQGYLGIHEIRDSFSIMPFALAKYKKIDIHHEKMEASSRRTHKDEIIDYLRVDCESLYELVTAFWNEFGDALTVGSAGLRELKKFHRFQTGRPDFDERIRSQYYYGGRVQVFKSGLIKGPIHVLDVNSMYPHVMSSCLHPIGTAIDVSKYIKRDTCFVTAEGISHGAFAVRTKLGIDFPWGSGTFHTTIHEWNAALETGSFLPKRIIKTYGFNDRTCFEQFVSHFYNAKVSAKVSGDLIHELFYKYLLNSTYGKFAQNPANFREYAISHLGEIMSPLCECVADECSCFGWQNEGIDSQKYMLWSRRTKTLRYYNIATAASITGAARSLLLHGIAKASNVYYCDTDSVFAQSPGKLPLSDTELGSWKVEAIADLAAICGKKLYALFDSQRNCVKKAHKGIPSARGNMQGITPAEIKRLASGDSAYVEVCNDVPHFKISGVHGFTKRKVRMTV